MKNDMNDQLFEALEDRLAVCEPKEGFGIRRDRWPIAVMCAGMSMTVPSILGVAGVWLGWLSAVGIVVELVGLAVFSFRQVRDVAPEFIDAKRKFAVELDRGLCNASRSSIGFARFHPKFALVDWHTSNLDLPRWSSATRCCSVRPIS